jgi:hypothetical protein
MQRDFCRRHILRRDVLAGLAALCAIGVKPAMAASPAALELDDPFLGETTYGDLVLAPSKISAASTLPETLDFFGIVRKTNVLSGEGDAGKINMLMLFAAFRAEDCRLTLCNMEALEGSSNPVVQRAREALATLAQKIKLRPDLVYQVQDVDKLPRYGCQKSVQT